ncbi:cystathionine beta-lyase [Bordetella bronchiseptica]|nr:cystathionine beta-lyase [Bordetella bronchiseptica]
MKPDTRLVHLGRDPERFEGLVNIPPCRTSTFLHASVADYQAAASRKQDSLYYGRFGSQTSRALEAACTELDGGHGAMLFPCGLAAITRVLGSLLEPGQHLLMADTVYGPARAFCEQELARLGVETTWYAPDADLDALVRPATRVIYGEAPGSLTFEMQDLRALAEVARRRGLVSVVDNTWATSWFCQPLVLGIDISIQSASKYIVGHSDAMLGVAVANEAQFPAVRRAAAQYGNAVSPDDCYLALRGLRTLGVRLARHQASALRVAQWLRTRAEVEQVLHPALPDSPGHALWRRDFSGASGLFGVAFRAGDDAALARFVDDLRLFGIGVSWGGFESLALPSHPVRSTSAAALGGRPLVRLHIGLEDPDDLIADLARALDRHMAAARG